MSSGDPVKGLRDGGGGEGEESHDLCAPAGGSLQHSTGLPAPAEARHSLQSGSRWLHWHNKHLKDFCFLSILSLLMNES